MVNNRKFNLIDDRDFEDHDVEDHDFARIFSNFDSTRDDREDRDDRNERVDFTVRDDCRDEKGDVSRTEFRPILKFILHAFYLCYMLFLVIMYAVHHQERYQ